MPYHSARSGDCALHCEWRAANFRTSPVMTGAGVGGSVSVAGFSVAVNRRTFGGDRNSAETRRMTYRS